MNIIAIYFIILATCSCTSKDDVLFPMNDTKENVSVLKYRVNTKGDRKAYYQLSVESIDDKTIDLLPYSKIMVDKYKYHEFCYDVFLGYFDKQKIPTTDDFPLEGLSETDRYYAISYLKLGAQKNDFQCLTVLANYYMKGRYMRLDTVLGQNLLKKAKGK